MANATKFTWKIENFSCLKDGCLQSPSFEPHSKQLGLTIYPADSKGYVNVQLKSIKYSSKFKLDCAIAFFDSEGTLLLWREKMNSFLGYDCYSGEHEVKFQIPESYDMEKIERTRSQKVREITVIKRDNLCGSIKILKDNILIIECHIWFKDILHSSPETFFARTLFEPNQIKKKKKFVLNVNDVSSLASTDILTHVEPIEETESDRKFLGINLTLNKEKTFFVSVLPPLFYRIHANFKISVLDVRGKSIPFANVDFDFNETQILKESFSTNISKCMLMAYPNRFLPNDILSLVFDCTLLYEISFNRLVSENEYRARNPQPIVLDCTAPEINPKPEIQPTISDTPNNVYRALMNIYEEGFLSDFSLRVQDKTFPVHKNILGARSSVFKAMFTADMKEKDSNSVNIPDADPDTIQQMLKFIYCDSVPEDMQWESASRLYAAADKYALEPLKQKCSDILKSGLSVSSALGVLTIADTHQDQDLKDTVIDFILENDKEIVGTEVWSKFAEEHNQLVFEAIHKLYMKKMDMQ